MKFVRLVSSLLYETPLSGYRSGFNSNLYCTQALARRRDTTPLEGSQLFSRISPARNLISIVPILDQWMEEGRSVDKPSLMDFMKKLLLQKRFSHALEVSMWMTDKRGIELTPFDASFRLYLISKAKGIDEAERYFNSLSEELKHVRMYGTLLKCYETENCVEKAESVMQQIRNLGSNHIHNYCFMLNLYRKTGNMEKFNALLQEMEEKGIHKTAVALEIQLSTYVDAMDVEGMDKIVSIIESDPNVASGWVSYSTAAAGYTKAGLFDKALQMLNKVEALVNVKGYDAYNYLITRYAALGRKDDVLRVWSLYKQKREVVKNNGYQCVLDMLVKLGDFEKAEEIFKEWESQCWNYDISVPNIVISAYSSRGLMGKAEALLNKAISKGGKPNLSAYPSRGLMGKVEALLNKAISKGGKPNPRTWYRMCEGYLLNEQYEKAVEMMKKAVIADPRTEKKPVPTVESIKACLKYLKGVGDSEKSEEFVKLLADNNVVSLDQLEELSVDKDE